MPTLYLNGYETEARLDKDCAEVTRIDHQKDDVHTMTVPFFDVERVVLVGRAAVTTPLLQRFAREGIPVHFVSGGGRWLGSLDPTVNGHALRRLRQYDLAKDHDFALRVAKACATAKLANCRRVLQRLSANRDQTHDQDQIDACNTLQAMLHKAEQATDPDSLRGCEGYAATVYFKRLGSFFPEAVPFRGRNRRPPRDAANALMSWTYTIVQSEVEAAVRCAGLDPCLGFLHEISYGRPSLSLDLLEPLRPCLCDMLVLRLLNHKHLGEDDFEFNSEDGGIYLKKDARKTFFKEYEKTMTRRFAETKHGEHTDFRGVIRHQVEALLRAMEGREAPAMFHMP